MDNKPSVDGPLYTYVLFIQSFMKELLFNEGQNLDIISKTATIINYIFNA